MTNEWADKNLPRANKDIAPAVYDEKEEDWTVVRGRDGRMWVRDDATESVLKEIKDKMGETDGTQKVELDFPDEQKVKNESVESRLESLESKQDSLLKALEKTNDTLEKVTDDDAVNTKVTGSIVAEEIDMNVIEAGKNKTAVLSPEKAMQLMFINEFRVRVSDDEEDGWVKVMFFLNERKASNRNRFIEMEGSSGSFFAIYPGYTPWNPKMKIPDFGMKDGEYTLEWYNFLKTVNFSKDSPLIIRIENNTKQDIDVKENLELILKEV